MKKHLPIPVIVYGIFAAFSLFLYAYGMAGHAKNAFGLFVPALSFIANMLSIHYSILTAREVQQ